MPYYTPDQIKDAKRLDLLTYLQMCEPGNLHKSGPNEWRTRDHDSLVISNGLWHWESRGIGGKTALDYLIRVRDMTFLDAMRVLAGNGSETPIVPREPPRPPPRTVPGDVKLPEANYTNSRVIAYLHNERGIPRGIINECIERKLLYEDLKTRSAVFVGYDSKGKPKHAFMRGTDSDVKKDVFGSDKRFSFVYALNENTPNLVLCESAIDALSVAAMHGERRQNCQYLSLNGTSPLAALTYIANHPGIETIHMCTDNDQAGRNAAERIKAAILEALPDRGLSILEHIPLYGKDFNECLTLTARENEAVQSRMPATCRE